MNTAATAAARLATATVRAAEIAINRAMTVLWDAQNVANRAEAKANEAFRAKLAGRMAAEEWADLAYAAHQARELVELAQWDLDRARDAARDWRARAAAAAAAAG